MSSISSSTSSSSTVNSLISNPSSSSSSSTSSAAERSLRPRPPRTEGPMSPNKIGRQILPLNATPSIIGPALNTPEKTDRTAMKAVQRIQHFYTSATVQHHMGYQVLGKGRTYMQGSSETDGYHASHVNCMPRTQDNMFDSVAQRIATKNQITPQSERYLKAKKIPHSPITNSLTTSDLNSPGAVKKILSQFLSPSKQQSVFAGTRLFKFTLSGMPKINVFKSS